MTQDTGVVRSVPTAAPKGGADIYRTISIIGAAVAIKSSPGRIFSIAAYNVNAALRYLKIYNKAAPTSSDTPAMTIVLPTGTLPPLSFPAGVDFSTAIGIRVTTGLADNDTGAPTVNETILNISYK